MSYLPPLLDLDTEASHISVQAAPGAVFLRLWRDRADGTARQMFVELTIREARSLAGELKQVIDIATLTAAP